MVDYYDELENFLFCVNFFFFSLSSFLSSFLLSSSSRLFMILSCWVCIASIFPWVTSVFVISCSLGSQNYWSIHAIELNKLNFDVCKLRFDLQMSELLLVNFYFYFVSPLPFESWYSLYISLLLLTFVNAPCATWIVPINLIDNASFILSIFSWVWAISFWLWMFTWSIFLKAFLSSSSLFEEGPIFIF